MLNRKQIAHRIASVKGRQETLNRDIQEILVETAGHVIEYGECSLYDKLLNATKGANREAIHSWIKDYGGARFHEGKFVVNATWLKEQRYLHDVPKAAKSAEECRTAREQFEAKLSESPLPLWYEEYQADEDNAVAKLWDAQVKVEELIAMIGKKSKSDKVQAQHCDIERYLRVAVEQYKEDRKLLETMAAESSSQDEGE